MENITTLIFPHTSVESFCFIFCFLTQKVVNHFFTFYRRKTPQLWSLAGWFSSLLDCTIFLRLPVQLLHVPLTSLYAEFLILGADGGCFITIDKEWCSFALLSSRNTRSLIEWNKEIFDSCVFLLSHSPCLTTRTEANVYVNNVIWLSLFLVL